MALALSGTDVESLIDLSDIADAVEEAQIKQDQGLVERPDRPHYPVGTGIRDDGPLGTGLVMPAYIHGSDYFATKLASIHEENPQNGLPTLHAQLVLADARTGVPVSFMNANHITNARTGCIGGLAARELATSPIKLAIIGAGTQARWQARAVAALCDLTDVSIYSPSDSKYAAADDLSAAGIPTQATESVEAAVVDANVVITTTTSTTPVISAEALRGDTLVVGIGAFRQDMQELDSDIIEQADRVFADVPEEVIEIGDLTKTSLSEDQLIPFGEAFGESTNRVSEGETTVVESVGSAAFDVAAATRLYSLAETRGVGTEVDL